MSTSESDNVKNANSVYYTAVADGTLVTRRTTKRHGSIDKVYYCSPEPQSRQLEFKFDLGSEYVDGMESYLKFKLEYNTSIDLPADPLPAKLSSGFTDLIQDIILIDRMVSRVSWPISISRKDDLLMPIPCSPVIVPPISMTLEKRFIRYMLNRKEYPRMYSSPVR